MVRKWEKTKLELYTHLQQTGYEATQVYNRFEFKNKLKRLLDTGYS